MRRAGFVLALVVCSSLLGGVGSGTRVAAGTEAAGTLRLSSAILAGRIAQVDCPQGTPDNTACFQSTTKGIVRGLGATSEQDLNFVGDPDSDCEKWHSAPVLTVSGKGSIELSFAAPGGCVVPTTGVLNASLVFTVTGGTGIYAGASGSGTVLARGGPGTTNRNVYTLDGNLSVPGIEFDLTPPVLHGAAPRTAFAPRKAKAIRVRYKVTAHDAVDGTVRATCKPRQGSRFKIGRTKVSCSAGDSSGNTARARFTVTVKRRH